MSHSKKTVALSTKAAQNAQLVKPVCGEYVADPRVYRSEILTPGYGSIAFVVLGVLLVVFDLSSLLSELAPLAKIAGIVMILGGVYTLQRTFLAHAYPRVIRMGDDFIEFESFGRKDRFSIDGLVRCAVREGGRGRSFLRIEDGGRSARYFLNVRDMETSDGESGMRIEEFLFAQEARLDPKNIRVKARKVNARKEAEAVASGASVDGSPKQK